jgi:hypothetical protein
MRIRWRAVWLVCWTLFLVADSLFNIRGRLTSLVAGVERGHPDVFYLRLQTGLLVVFVVVALAPLVWPLVKRWLVVGATRPAAPIARDPRDVTLAEALGYLAHQSAWGARRAAAGPTLLQDAATLIEDAARKGRLELRGMPPGGSAREAITGDYWLTAGIDLAATIDASGGGGRTAAHDPGRGRQAPVYDAVVVDRRALAALWPPDNVWRRTGRATVRGVAQGVRIKRRRPESE